ncbi:probable F-box protein At4g22030 [Vigna unguiculata]|uniref:probable F-box protein At4g22030 n=1 Tax=Vigna unguiculata TaxID=3917 RepID=UPI001017192D|nr:probable F-box protein At4g22030 [Vigna unguiculata]
MASLQTAPLLSSSSSSSLTTINASLHLPNPPPPSYSVPKLPSTTLRIHQINGSKHNIPLEKNVVTTHIYQDLFSPTNKSNNPTVQLYAILEEVADRIQMHANIGEQRNNWNTLLLNSVNIITLTATAMAGVAAATTADAGAPLLALKLSSTLLFSAVTGMSLIMNKIQPSQLAEEQRNATRLFKQLHTQIQTLIAIGNPTEKDVKSSMEKVLALDRAYPLPLLGAMLDKFPAKYEPAVWWPSSQSRRKSRTQESKRSNNGWSEELEKELREVMKVIKKKDSEDYERLGNIALKVSKSLAIAGPLLSGIAAVGSSFLGNGSLAALVPLLAGSLASAVNAFEHGGQVGMVFEMYRNCGGFFTLLEETIRETLEEKDSEKRENGEVFEMKVAIKLGRSVSELRRLASKSASCGMEGIAVDEFASKLF